MKRLLLLLLAIPALGHAAAPAMSFSVATGNVPTLTWDCGAGATGAVASGSWTGSRAVSGSQAAAAITDTATYSLRCDFAGKNFIDLSWTPPALNTDGSQLTDLAGYKIYRGTTAANLTLLTTIASPATLAFKDTGLAAGTYFYALTAYNTSSVESARTATGSGTATASSSLTASVKITVPTVPGSVVVQ